MFFTLLGHTAKAEDFVWLLDDLRLEPGRGLHVVRDNLGAHRRAENHFQAIAWPHAPFHRLPTYAPQLNPVEHVWTTGKWGPLANAPPEGLDHLNRQAHAELARQAEEQRLLRARFRRARLERR